MREPDQTQDQEATSENTSHAANLESNKPAKTIAVPEEQTEVTANSNQITSSAENENTTSVENESISTSINAKNGSKETTPPKKEQPTMTQANPITRNSNPQSPPAIETQEINPLEETTQIVDILRDQIKNFDEQMQQVVRKLKEAHLLQRQKEREYNTTSRRLERIRQASGF